MSVRLDHAHFPNEILAFLNDRGLPLENIEEPIIRPGKPRLYGRVVFLQPDPTNRCAQIIVNVLTRERTPLYEMRGYFRNHKWERTEVGRKSFDLDNLESEWVEDRLRLAGIDPDANRFTAAEENYINYLFAQFEKSGSIYQEEARRKATEDVIEKMRAALGEVRNFPDSPADTKRLFN